MQYIIQKLYGNVDIISILFIKVNGVVLFLNGENHFAVICERKEKEMRSLNVQNFIRENFDIKNEATVNKLAESAEILKLKKPQLLFEAGSANDKVYLLVEGVLQAYFTDEDDRRSLDHFYWKNGAIIIGNAAFEERCDFSVSALSHCCLIAFPASILKRMTESNLEMAGIYNRCLAESLKERMAEKNGFFNDSPQLRLEWLQKMHPEMEELIQDKYLADYMHMTAVTMSRLRRKIRESKLKKL